MMTLFCAVKVSDIDLVSGVFFVIFVCFARKFFRQLMAYFRHLFGKEYVRSIGQHADLSHAFR